MGITGDSEKLYGGEEKFCHRSPYPLNHCDQGCNVVFHGFFNNTMKGLKKFRKRIGLVSRTTSSSSCTNNLQPVRFHTTHGSNITLHKNRTIAKRRESFCKGLTFTDRPIRVGEKIYIKFLSKSDSWSGVIRFGYTSHDPDTLKDRLPKYACPDLANQKGYWAKAVNERFVDKDVTLYFYVNKSGSVYYGIDGRTKDVFFQGVDTSTPLWAIIDVYGNSTAVELVNVQLNNSLTADEEAGFGLSRITPRSSVISSDTEVASDFRRLSCNTYSANSRERCTQPSITTPSDGLVSRFATDSSDSGYVNHFLNGRPETKMKQFDLKLMPLSFHEKYGQNIRLSNNKLIASRTDIEFCKGYVFTPCPVGANEFIVVEILKTDSQYLSGLAFGVTSENPSRIDVHDLPEDADELIDRSNSFIVYKNVANTPSEGDKLIFLMTESGEVKMKKNNENEVSLFYVERNVPYWWFFDLYGSTTKIRAFSGVFECHNAVSHSSQKVPNMTTVNNECHQSPSLELNTGQIVNLNSNSPSHSVVNNSPPVLVVKCYSGNYEPINIILQNQPSSSRIITQNPSPISSQVSNIRYHAAPNGYASVLPISHGENFDNSLVDNGRNREYQLQEWAKSNSRNYPSNSRLNECTVCYEKPVDAVLYTCGHMCLCYDCAKELWRGKGDGHCPICRATIRDVIRTYKS